MLSVKSITGQMISTKNQDVIVLYDTQGNQLVAIPKEQIDWSLRVLDNGGLVKEDGFTDRERYLRAGETPTLFQQVMEDNQVRQEEEEKLDEEQDVICGGRLDTTHVNHLAHSDGGEELVGKMNTQKDLRELEETRLMMMAETEFDLDRAEFEEDKRQTQQEAPRCPTNREKPDPVLGICCARVGSGLRKAVGRCKAQARSTETDWEKEEEEVIYCRYCGHTHTNCGSIDDKPNQLDPNHTCTTYDLEPPKKKEKGNYRFFRHSNHRLPIKHLDKKDFIYYLLMFNHELEIDKTKFKKEILDNNWMSKETYTIWSEEHTIPLRQCLKKEEEESNFTFIKAFAFGPQQYRVILENTTTHQIELRSIWKKTPTDYYGPTDDKGDKIKTDDKGDKIKTDDKNCTKDPEWMFDWRGSPYFHHWNLKILQHHYGLISGRELQEYNNEFKRLIKIP